MKTKAVDVERICWKIWTAFDFDEDSNPFDGIDGKPPNLGQFLSDLIEKKQLEYFRRDLGKITKRDKEVFEVALCLVYSIPFAFGYVMGQMFDIPSSEIQKEIAKIKKVLREKALLPYVPREKKGE